MKLLFYEFRKLAGRSVFLLLVLFFTGVLLVRFHMSSVELDTVDKVTYREILGEVSELSEKEALERLQRDRDGLVLLSFSEALDGSEERQEYFEEQYAALAEHYGLTVMEMVSEYDAYQGNPEERKKLQTVASTMATQYEYAETYREFLEGLPEQAAELETLSIFSKTGSYSFRSIKKGLRDYQRLGSVEVQPDYDQGVKALGSNAAAILFVFILTLGAAVILFSEEEGNGLAKLLRTTERGHSPLVLSKWGTLLVSSALLAVLFFGGQAVIAGIRLGFGDMSRPIQSVSSFQNCCYRICVLGYVMDYVLLPTIPAMAFASLAAFLFVLLKRPWIASGAVAAFTGMEYTFYRLIPENAALNFLKFVNLFCPADAWSRFTEYCNINLVGFPTSVLPAALIACLLLVMAGCVGCVLAFSRGLELRIGVPGFLKRKHKVRGSVSLSLQENYRLYIGAFGIVAMAALLVLGYRKLQKGDLLLSDSDYQYYAYGQEIAGEVTEDTAKWFQRKNEELNREASGGIDSSSDMTEDERREALFKARIKSRDIQEKRDILQKIQDEFILLEMARMRGVPVHYISGIQTEPVFDEGNRYLLSAMLLMAILCLAFCPMFSQDEEGGMGKLVHTTRFGRGRSFFTRYLTLFLFYTAAFLLFFLPYLYNWLKVVRMTDWEAPVQSVLRYVEVEGSMSLRTLVILWGVGSYTSGLGFVVMMSLLSKYCRRNSTTMIVSMVVIASDILVNLLGFPAISSIVLGSGFALTEILERAGNTWVLYVILVKNVLAAGALLLWHGKKYVG